MNVVVRRRISLSQKATLEVLPRRRPLNGQVSAVDVLVRRRRAFAQETRRSPVRREVAGAALIAWRDGNSGCWCRFGDGNRDCK